MFDQKKMLTENFNPIVALIKYESKIEQLDAERQVKVKLTKGGKELILTHYGIDFIGAVDRPIKHQIGSRLWGNTKSFMEIDNIWHNKFCDNPSHLEHELSSAFKKNDLSIRYIANDNGKNNIYGIVTPHFYDVNQLDFRKKFLDTFRKNITPKPKSCGVIQSRYGQVTELFEINTPGFQTTYRYGLVYAKNNGYDAYKVNWEREVLICTNGLTKLVNSNYRWKHTKEINLNNFINDTVNEGLANQRYLEKRINESKEKPLIKSMLSELMARLSLAQASKMRIQNRLNVEVNDVGNNEWALSQALTWVGSHEKHLPYASKSKLIDLGTQVLEKSICEILQTKVQTGRNGYYNLILPKDLLVARHYNKNNSF